MTEKRTKVEIVVLLVYDNDIAHILSMLDPSKFAIVRCVYYEMDAPKEIPAVNLNKVVHPFFAKRVAAEPGFRARQGSAHHISGVQCEVAQINFR